MKAAVFTEKGKIEIRDLCRTQLPDTDAGKRGAILRPLYVSPCSSDVHTVFAGNGPRRENMVLGHEGIAEILETGPLVRDFRKGDIVCVCAVMPEEEEDAQFGKEDGESRNSGEETLNGHENYPFSACKLGRNLNGMWQEAFYVPDADRNLAVIPGGLSSEDALMAVDVMATGFSAAEDAGIREGQTAVVFGTGAIGLMTIAALAEKKAHVLAVGSPNRTRNTELAGSFGAEAVLSYTDGTLLLGNTEAFTCGNYGFVRSPYANSLSSPLVDRLLDLTGGRGFDRCILTGGLPDSLKEACDVLKYGTGLAVNISYIEGTGDVSLPVFSLGRGMAGKTFRFSLSRGGRAWTERMLQKAQHLHPGSLVTDRLRGFSALPEALSLMRERKNGTIKILVDLTEGFQ